MQYMTFSILTHSCHSLCIYSTKFENLVYTQASHLCDNIGLVLLFTWAGN